METTMTPNEGSSVNITMIVSDAEGDPDFTEVNPTNGTISGGGTNASSDSNCTYTDYCISAGFACTSLGTFTVRVCFSPDFLSPGNMPRFNLLMMVNIRSDSVEFLG